MKLPYSIPDPAGTERSKAAKAFRDLATEISRLQPQALTRANAEEDDHGPVFPANFTKGLLHDKDGLLTDMGDYQAFVEGINAPNHLAFDEHVVTAPERSGGSPFHCTIGESTEIAWRGWESPRSGHAYELQGPDAGAVGMAPAPRIGSSELAAEMAEVYGLALLRDVPFEVIEAGGDEKIFSTGEAQLNASQIVDLLNDMPFFDGDGVISSTPMQTDASGLNRFERNRRYGRTQDDANPFTAQMTTATAFRGSTPGALVGPTISQFMYIGGDSLAGMNAGGTPSKPNLKAKFELHDGLIPYGSIVIDQRTVSHKVCLDHMTNWCHWLDVQNGGDLRGTDVYDEKRRFITTPRDLATYVHFDALYEAYLNAALILLGMGAPASKGFPEPSPSGKRTAFATFGGPHILSLVTEVATRCLKAVRRQKFNYHRRARPEALGGRLVLSETGNGAKLGLAEPAFDALLGELPAQLKQAIIDHNMEQNGITERPIVCDPSCRPDDVTKNAFKNGNLLLPMAFPEGSPMHPAYGAGHATVAGGCVTMLKAFFEMFTDGDSFKERPLVFPRGPNEGNAFAFIPDSAKDYETLKDLSPSEPLTIQGELDKLAANISIGRNMAGVHYYSDYYDSVRMGERIAVGILLEQAPTYGDYVESTFTSFDGDHVTLSGEAGSCPSLSIINAKGEPETCDHWWLRHVSGSELSEDL